VSAPLNAIDGLLGDLGPAWRSTRRHRAFALLVLEVGVNFVVIANLVILGRWFGSPAQFSTGHRERDLVEVRLHRSGRAAGGPAASHAAEESALRAMPGVLAVAPVSSMQSDDEWAVPDVFWSDGEAGRVTPKQVVDMFRHPCPGAESTSEGRLLGWVVEAGPEFPQIAELTFTEADPVASRRDGVVVSRCLAEALFGPSPAIGRSLYTNRRGVTRIVGVVEPVRMRSPLLYQTEITALYVGDADDGRKVRYLLRTAPGAAEQVARTAPAALRGLISAGGVADARVFAPIGPGVAENGEGTVQVFFVVGGCLGLAALLGNVTVAAFTVAARRRSIAIRRALGATRADIFRQLWIEAMIPTVMGCALGLALTGLLLTQSRQLFPGLHLGLVDAAVTAFVLWSTAVPTRVIPALRSIRLTPAEAARTL